MTHSDLPSDLLHPPPLGEGSRVDVVSPAGPVTPELLEPGLKVLRDWNLRVEVTANVYGRHAPGYLAGDDRQRLQSVQAALANPETDAVIFSRGGYGTMRLLDRLDLAPLADAPKLLVGFSDLTALHLYAAGRHRLPTLHAPVVKSLRLHEAGDRSMEALRDALFGRRAEGFEVEGLRCVRSGTASGRVLGGNLTLVVHMLASPYCPDLNGAILLLEDVGEEDYRLDRMLTALRLSRKAARPAAIALGEFSDCHGAYVEADELDGFVATLAAEFDCPVVAGFPSGHGTDNLAVPMGVQATLEAGESSRLVFHGDAARSAHRPS